MYRSLVSRRLFFSLSLILYPFLLIAPIPRLCSSPLPQEEPPVPEKDNYFWVFVMCCGITGIGTIVTGCLAWDAAIKSCYRGRGGLYGSVISTEPPPLEV